VSKEVPLNDFGLLIAYILPGFAALWGCSYLNPSVGQWMLVSGGTSPTVAGFLYSTVASLATGLTVSTVRWLVIDPLHHATGIRQPNRDYAKLDTRVGAYELLTDYHYKFYQFYSNMLVSLCWVYGTWRATHSTNVGLAEIGFLLLAIVFYLGSRDTLRKYYERTGQLLSGEPAGSHAAGE
jgi:hypothetical protein